MTGFNMFVRTYLTMNFLVVVSDNRSGRNLVKKCEISYVEERELLLYIDMQMELAYLQLKKNRLGAENLFYCLLTFNF